MPAAPHDFSLPVATLHSRDTALNIPPIPAPLKPPSASPAGFRNGHAFSCTTAAHPSDPWGAVSSTCPSQQTLHTSSKSIQTQGEAQAAASCRTCTMITCLAAKAYLLVPPMSMQPVGNTMA